MLNLRAVASARSGIAYGSGKVFLYEVEGLPEGQRISIKNTRASVKEPVWEIGCHIAGQETKWTGAFKTAEDALAQLQREIDAADKATPEELERIVRSRGWGRVPVMGSSNAVIFSCGQATVRVRLTDFAWAFYTEIRDGKTPDKWGKDIPSLLAFFSSYDGLKIPAKA